MILAGDFAPMTVNTRINHCRVARNVPVDLGQLDPVGERQEQGENLRPADDERSWSGQRQRLFN